MSSEILNSLVEFEKNDQWLQEHYDEIQEKYENKFIAIEEGKIIAEGKTADEVIKKLKQKKKNPALVLVEFIPKKGIKIIL